MELTSKNKRIAKIAIYAAFAVVVLVAFFFWARYIEKAKAYHVDPLKEETLMSIGVKNCKKLMIVAHPDDEFLWGGAHLKEGGYLVVCITNGKKLERHDEFINAVEKSGNTPLILGYPDKVLGKRDEWTEVRDKIEDDLGYIMSYNDWELIVTHNPSGEYGHIHHVMTNEIVTKLYERQKPSAKLWFFGKYYKASDLPAVKDKLTPITEEELDFKESLRECYPSQEDTIEKLSHMVPYEMWTEYQPA
ncbi:PIG-L family deacetylase [Ruminococcus sp. NK3A76]|uniref:PIG-L family deacetylase n=1 Tax=Ruminococcus sp. NK3A76 TaxID=877411 RepID=UPI00068C250E|nr:PIG-L family deacetylase [Ruminococcus sp. NK3A76]